jgi:hypothetical protein
MHKSVSDVSNNSSTQQGNKPSGVANSALDCRKASESLTHLLFESLVTEGGLK